MSCPEVRSARAAGYACSGGDGVADLSGGAGCRARAGDVVLDGAGDARASSASEVIEHEGDGEDRGRGVGLLLSAMSGAEPCTGSNIEGNAPSG
jgi:hypothetical protein